MASFEKSIDVDVPVAEAYMMFSDFESFPSFMEGVESVERLSDDKLRWRANIGGREEEWDARVTEQAPSNAIAWESTSGATNAGRVTFDKLDQDTTRVNMHIEYEPEGFLENVGAMLGIVNGRIAAKNQWLQLSEDEKRATQRIMVEDGAITPACAQACPSQAIVFGDLLDPNSRVAKLHKHERTYEMLEELNTKPRTRYMGNVRNPSRADA